MRFIPILTALLVMAFLVAAVLFRSELTDFAANPPWATGEETAQDVIDAAPDTDMTDSVEQDDASLITVVVKRSVATEIDSAVVLRGETAAARNVDVRSETSARVISEPLRKGAFVEAGQEMCRLDPGIRLASLAEAEARLGEARARMPETEARIPEAEARVAEARARLEEALVNNNAAENLIDSGFVSETRVKSTLAAVRAAEAQLSAALTGLETAASGRDSTLAAIESAEAAVAAAETELSRLEIRAPFGGILEDDTAELGSLLQPGALCGTVLQLDPMKIVGFVPETEVSRVRIGAKAEATLATGQVVTGNVSFLARSADAATRTFRVELEVPNVDLSLRDGQTAEIIISAPGDLAHLLPQSSLTLNDAGALGVRTVTAASETLFMPVTLLRDTREGVWVADLPDRVDVITLGQEYVTDGVRVGVAYEEELQQ